MKENTVKRFIRNVIHEKAYDFNDGYGKIDFKSLKIDDSDIDIIKCELKVHVNNDVYLLVFFENELSMIFKNNNRYFIFDFDTWQPSNLKELIEKIG